MLLRWLEIRCEQLLQSASGSASNLTSGHEAAAENSRVRLRAETETHDTFGGVQPLEQIDQPGHHELFPVESASLSLDVRPEAGSDAVI